MYITQDVANRIKQQLKSQGKSMKEMLTCLDMGVNSISEFAKGKQLSSISLAKIADYLNCSVDYLLGRQNFSVPPDIEKKNNAIADIVLRLRSDAELLSIVEDLSTLPSDKLQAVKTLISVIKK